MKLLWLLSFCFIVFKYVPVVLGQRLYHKIPELPEKSIHANHNNGGGIGPANPFRGIQNANEFGYVKGAWSGSGLITENNSGEIFYPGDYLNLSTGPRRRRSEESRTLPDIVTKTVKEFLDLPLFCWKFVVNCRIFPKHICCPVMPDEMKKKKRKRKRNPTKSNPASTRDARGFDPIFGIPIVEKRSDILNSRVQEWKPYSPEYIGMSVTPLQKRCQYLDCSSNPGHYCCPGSDTDRIYPIGPYVQPSLVENWVSALFEFSGRNPVAFTLFKKMAIVAILALTFMIYGYVGHMLGFVKSSPTSEAKHSKTDRHDSNLNELTKNIFFALDSENWKDKLEKFVLKHGARGAATDFLCCFVPENISENGSKMIRCTPKPRKKSQQKKSTLQCLSDLIYDVSFNKTKKKKTDLVMDNLIQRRDSQKLLEDEDPSQWNQEVNKSIKPFIFALILHIDSTGLKEHILASIRYFFLRSM